MYEEYKEKTITPLSVVKDLRNYKITDSEAVKQIEYCIYKEIQRETPMGKDEVKKIKLYICELLYDRYDIKPKGNADMINDTLKEALKQLGKGCDIKKIPKKYFNDLKDILFSIV